MVHYTYLTYLCLKKLNIVINFHLLETEDTTLDIFDGMYLNLPLAHMLKELLGG